MKINKLWWSNLFYVKFRNLLSRWKILEGQYKGDCSIIGIIRMRNEELILKDTLDHMASHVDAFVVFDDRSTDGSVDVALNHPKVIEVIVNDRWRKNRTWEETANRRKLLQRAKKYNPKWLFYFDADERFEGKIKDYLSKDPKVNGIRISLFDAYMTEKDKNPYKGGQLYNFRKYFGIERRDILMIWRHDQKVDYYLPDSREPQGVDGEIITKFYCQHYGKSLSTEHWEETCDYYSKNFPQYAEKWEKRKGKSVHKRSDFDTELFDWKNVRKNYKKI